MTSAESHITPQGESRIGVAEAARMTGFSADTIRRAADSGKLPHTRTPGGQRRFSVAAVKALLNPVGTAPVDGPPAGEASPSASPATPVDSVPAMHDEGATS